MQVFCQAKLLETLINGFLVSMTIKNTTIVLFNENVVILFELKYNSFLTCVIPHLCCLAWRKNSLIKMYFEFFLKLLFPTLFMMSSIKAFYGVKLSHDSLVIWTDK